MKVAVTDCTFESLVIERSILEPMDQVLLTPHVASASVPAVTKLRTTAAEIAARAVLGQRMPNVVNGVDS